MSSGGGGGFQSSFLDSSDLLLEGDLDPKLGELLYSDQPPTNPKEIERKAKWIVEAYGPIVEKSTNKT